MPEKQSKLSKFWQELKRRKVVRVIIVYATTAFILLQLISILIEPLHLPQWVMTLVIVLLGIGFPIAVIFSWIFDVTPTGIEVTHSTKEKNISPKIGLFRKKYLVFDIIIGILIIVVIILAYPKLFKGDTASKIDPELEKSIAVLPFINDSNDSTKVYVINGLMESILTNLQKIKDLRVISRTSVEKYRKHLKLIPEIGKELNANYIVEGSGQLIGEQIILTVQLIESATDKHLWSNEYINPANVDGYLDIRTNVAKDISKEIRATITPEEMNRIEKKPTENDKAFNLFLMGQEVMNQGIMVRLPIAIAYFEQAIVQDSNFALAYAQLSNCHFYLEYSRSEREREELIDRNSEMALLLDNQLPESLFARSNFHLYLGNYKLSQLYVKKVLEYNPNSYEAYNRLRALNNPFAGGSPNLESYIEYALNAIYLEIPSDSAGIIKLRDAYHNLARAFRHLGFLRQAKTYYKKSLDIDPDYTNVLREMSELIVDSNSDYDQSIQRLQEILNKDSTDYGSYRLIGVSHLMNREFTSALEYHQKYLSLVNINISEYNGSYTGRLAFIFDKLGDEEEASLYLDRFRKYVGQLDGARYGVMTYIQLTTLYSLEGNLEDALKNLRIIVKNYNPPYQRIRVFKDSPLYDNMRKDPEFQRLIKVMETKFWENHERIKANLNEKGLL